MFLSLMALMAFSIIADVSFAQNLHIDKACTIVYEETQKCPDDVCYLGCAPGLMFEGCPKSCWPKTCFEITANNCPLDRCQVLDGCGGTKKCYPQTYRSPDDCGDLAYAGQEVECCEGLNRRCGIEFFDGTCEWEGNYSAYSVPVCLPCGNGICNQFENACNCPEDCPPQSESDVKERQKKAIFVKPEPTE